MDVVVALEHDRDLDGIADPVVEAEQRLVPRHRADPLTRAAEVLKITSRCLSMRPAWPRTRRHPRRHPTTSREMSIFRRHTNWMIAIVGLLILGVFALPFVWAFSSWL
jgi:hypothetical protein